MNQRMMETLAHAKMDDMRGEASWRSTSRRHVVPAHRGTSWVQPGVAHEAKARRAVGWFLVSVGLRLALPRGRSVPAL
jgi:hypothetical protein